VAEVVVAEVVAAFDIYIRVYHMNHMNHRNVFQFL